MFAEGNVIPIKRPIINPITVETRSLRLSFDALLKKLQHISSANDNLKVNVF